MPEPWFTSAKLRSWGADQYQRCGQPQAYHEGDDGTEGSICDRQARHVSKHAREQGGTGGQTSNALTPLLALQMARARAKNGPRKPEEPLRPRSAQVGCSRPFG